MKNGQLAFGFRLNIVNPMVKNPTLRGVEICGHIFICQLMQIGSHAVSMFVGFSRLMTMKM
jgi:hypothetical protein